MAKKTYETIFALGAKIESSMGKAFGKAQKNINKLDKYTKKANKTSKEFSNTVKAVGVSAAAYMGFKAAANYVNEATEAAKSAMEVEKKLETVLVERTNATDEQIKAILDLTDAQENLGVVAGDVQIAGAQQLGTFINQTESLEVLTPAMNNLLAQQKGLNATQTDAVNIGNLMGKVMQGQTSALTRVGISFTAAQEEVLKYGNEQEKAAMLAQVITDNVGEMNKSLAETDSGKILQAKNVMGKMQEEIGKKILPIQGRFYNWFASKVPKIQTFATNLIDKISAGADWISDSWQKISPTVNKVISKFGDFSPNINKIIDNVKWLKNVAIEAFNNIKAVIAENAPRLQEIQTKFSEIATNIETGLKSGFEAVKPVIEWLFTEGLPQVVNYLIGIVDKATMVYTFITENWSVIEPIVYGIVGAFATYQAITIALSIVTGVASGAMTAFGVAIAFATSPIGIIVLAIGALIAIGVLLYKNWDQVKAFFLKITGKIKDGAIKVFNKIKDFLVKWGPLVIAIITGPFGLAIYAIAKNWDKIKAVVSNAASKVKDGIIKAFNKVKDFLVEWGPLILAILTGPFGLAVFAIVKNWDTIKEFFTGLWTSIQEIFANVGSWFGEQFVSAVEGIKLAFNGVGEFFEGIFNTVVDAVKGNINGLIGIVNFMIDKLNEIQIDIPEGVPGIGGTTIGFSIPNIPQLATGGIIKRQPGGILANIGEGRYDEAVIPLNSRVDRLLGNTSKESDDNLTINYNPQIIIQGNADQETVKTALDESKREFEKFMNAWLKEKKRLKFA